MGNNFHKSGLGSDFEKDFVPFETAPLPNLPPQAGEGTARAMLRLMAYCLTVPSPACGGRLGRGLSQMANKDKMCLIQKNGQSPGIENQELNEKSISQPSLSSRTIGLRQITAVLK